MAVIKYAGLDALSELKNNLALKDHVHSIANVTNLQTSLDNKITAKDGYFKTFGLSNDGSGNYAKLTCSDGAEYKLPTDAVVNAKLDTKITSGSEAYLGSLHISSVPYIYSADGYNLNFMYGDSSGNRYYESVASIVNKLNSHEHSQYYDSNISRTANTVLAAPNGSSGSASFRRIEVADLPGGTQVASKKTMFVPGVDNSAANPDNAWGISANVWYGISPFSPGIRNDLFTNFNVSGGSTNFMFKESGYYKIVLQICAPSGSTGSLALRRHSALTTNIISAPVREGACTMLFYASAYDGTEATNYSFLYSVNTACTIWPDGNYYFCLIERIA